MLLTNFVNIVTKAFQQNLHRIFPNVVIFSCVEARDKALRECERLRDHLLTVEEASTKEALAGEERETELRQRIRILEQKTEESADNVIESANAYQVTNSIFQSIANG